MCSILLSGRPEVQILLATLTKKAENTGIPGFSAFYLTGNLQWFFLSGRYSIIALYCLNKRTIMAHMQDKYGTAKRHRKTIIQMKENN